MGSLIKKRSRFVCCIFSGILFLSAIQSMPQAWAMSRKPKEYRPFPTFPIELKVDFGATGKPLHVETLQVEKGTTPKEAVSQVFPIQSGKVCCSLKDVYSIDGVKVDPSSGGWWICLLNGSKDVAPGKYKLKKGDVIEWKYIQG